MSDAGSEIQDVPAAEVEEQVEVADKSGPMSVEDALQAVIKTALVHDGLARGLRECTKALDKKEAHLCVLVETVTEGELLLRKGMREFSLMTFYSRVPQAHRGSLCRAQHPAHQGL
jgi:small subunit ribosomal protein S12e